jgi:hypothetical protein
VLEAALRHALVRVDPIGASVKMRLVRAEARQAIAEVPHTALPLARRAWNGSLTLPSGATVAVVTLRTYGTLRKGKEWLRRGVPGPGRRPAAVADPSVGFK